MGYPKWNEAVGAALLVIAAMTAAAYGYTPYIKIRGKIYALTVQDSQPDPEDTPAGAKADPDHDPAPDAYSGLLTARKLWWIIIPVLAISTGNIYAFVSGRGEGWVAAIGIGMLLFFAVAAGAGDASWGYGIARGQHLQFALATVITAGAFAVIYLIAYFAAKRWPLRREQSMEYRAIRATRKSIRESRPLAAPTTPAGQPGQVTDPMPQPLTPEQPGTMNACSRHLVASGRLPSRLTGAKRHRARDRPKAD
jgi:hypothetical protein